MPAARPTSVPEVALETEQAQTLAKNIWELQQLIESGQAKSRARQMLLRAYAEQVAYNEDKLGVAPEHRAFLLPRDDTREGVLLVHGATGSPRDLRDLAEFLHAGGFSVYCMRLPGHGTKDQNDGEIRWESALYDVESRYKQLSDCCKNVSIVGYSFGATLAMQIDLKPRPSSLVLLAPALFPRLGWFQRTLLSMGLDRFEFVRRSLGWQAELLDAMAAARKQKWWYGIPVHGVMCKDDPRIDTRSMSFLRSRLNHHRTHLEELPTGGHTFHREQHADAVQREVLEFLRANRAPRNAGGPPPKY